MKRAFTLIELLVVIAILAILAAILFPVFARAKMAAKQSADLSNTKQILLGVKLYVSEFDDTYPLVCFDDGHGGGIRWSGNEILGPYVKNLSIFKAPIETSDLSLLPAFFKALPEMRDLHKVGVNSYFCNGVEVSLSGYPSYYQEGHRPVMQGGLFGVGAIYSPTSFSEGGTMAPIGTTTRDSQPAYPSELIAIGGGATSETRTDGVIYGFGPYCTNAANTEVAIACLEDFQWEQETTDVGARDILRDYNGGENYGLADGHAKYMKASFVAPTRLINQHAWIVSPGN